MYKIVLVGDWGVGKTNILSRYTRGEFILGSPGTVGVQFSTKSLVIDGANIKVQVWDTAGQDKFRAITSAYYRGAHGALLIYDITRQETFKRLDSWIKELKEYMKESCSIILIGNKCDLEHLSEVKQEDAINYAKMHDFAFFVTSALNSTNIQDAFDSLITQIHANNSKSVRTEQETLTTSISGKRISLNEPIQETSHKKSCCH